MLDYRVIGPDAEGLYSLAYPTPGATSIMTIAGSSRIKAQAEAECERLNELQIVDRRKEIRGRADRMSNDLQREAGKVRRNG